MVISCAPLLISTRARDRAAGTVGHQDANDPLCGQRSTGVEFRVAGALDQCLAQVRHSVARAGPRIVRPIEFDVMFKALILLLAPVDGHSRHRNLGQPAATLVKKVGPAVTLDIRAGLPGHFLGQQHPQLSCRILHLSLLARSATPPVLIGAAAVCSRRRLAWAYFWRLITSSTPGASTRQWWSRKHRASRKRRTAWAGESLARSTVSPVRRSLCARATALAMSVCKAVGGRAARPHHMASMVAANLVACTVLPGPIMLTSACSWIAAGNAGNHGEALNDFAAAILFIDGMR